MLRRSVIKPVEPVVVARHYRHCRYRGTGRVSPQQDSPQKEGEYYEFWREPKLCYRRSTVHGSGVRVPHVPKNVSVETSSVSYHVLTMLVPTGLVVINKRGEKLK